ncbi:MAG: SigE family RNA polymerase sigma factor [Kineosporiaceae bacterium]
MDEPDFEAFVSARSLALTRFAYLLTGDRAHAEDVVQEALVKAYRHWGRVLRSDHPEAYVRRIVVTTHLNERRRLRWRRERTTAAVPDAVGTRAWDDPGVAVVESDALHRALLVLPPRQRAVLVMRHYLTLDDATIAAELDCSETTVRATASRGRARLRELLADTDESAMSRGTA